MKLSQLLTEQSILLPLTASDKWEAIANLADAMVERSGLPVGLLSNARAALVAREESATTGMEHGIAIPHASIDDLADVSAILGVAPDGVPFEALDGKPAQIIICLLIPRDRKLQHIRTLAAIAKLMSRDSVRAGILACKDAAAVLQVIREQEDAV